MIHYAAKYTDKVKVLYCQMGSITGVISDRESVIYVLKNTQWINKKDKKAKIGV